MCKKMLLIVSLALFSSVTFAQGAISQLQILVCHPESLDYQKIDVSVDTKIDKIIPIELVSGVEDFRLKAEISYFQVAGENRVRVYADIGSMTDNQLGDALYYVGNADTITSLNTSTFAEICDLRAEASGKTEIMLGFLRLPAN